MRTLDEQNRQEFGWHARATRNVKLLWRLARLVVGYFTAGRRIRRDYRAKERSGEIYYVDAD